MTHRRALKLIALLPVVLVAAAAVMLALRTTASHGGSIGSPASWPPAPQPDGVSLLSTPQPSAVPTPSVLATQVDPTPAEPSIRHADLTQRRLDAHGVTKRYVPPPWYLLAQGITRVPGAGRRVAITFDDGPSGNTKSILATLSRFKVHATFFMVGVRVEVSPDLCRDVIAEGSELGNHTMMHTELWHVPVSADESEIMSADAVFAKVAGVHPVYVRPQGGQLDANGLRAIKALHKRFAYWDVASCDTVRSFSAYEIRDIVLKDARPGSVILFHETNPKTAEALPWIISGLERRGYQVMDLTELLSHSGTQRT